MTRRLAPRSGLIVVAALGGCHLIGGAGDLDFDVDPAGTGGPGTGGDATTTVGGGGSDGGGGSNGGGGSGGSPGVCDDGVLTPGEICFAPSPMEIVAGQIASGMVIVDCNMDGLLDVVLVGRDTHATSNAVVRALQNDDGAFTIVDTVLGSPTQGEPVAVVAGDFQTVSGGRELAIVLTASGADGPMLRRVGSPNGCSYTSQDAGTELPRAPAAMAAGKIDGDALDDVVVTFADGMNPELWIHRSASSVATVNGSALVPVGVVAAHFDKDNQLDVAYVDASKGEAVLRPGTSGTFSGLPSKLPVGSGPIAIAAGDLNGDGKIDLVAVNGQGNSISVAFGDGFGGFNAASTTFVDSKSPFHIALGDIDGDGDIDIVTSNVDAPTFVDVSLSLLLNDGSGQFSMAPDFPVDLPAPPIAAAIVDINDDGANDLVYATQTVGANKQNKVFVWLAQP